MKQKHVYLTEPQIEILNKIAATDDISFSEALRNVLKEYIHLKNEELLKITSKAING